MAEAAEMRQKDYVQMMKSVTLESKAKEFHRQAVEKAISSGQRVAEVVLDDYPDLKKAAKSKGLMKGYEYMSGEKDIDPKPEKNPDKEEEGEEEDDDWEDEEEEEDEEGDEEEDDDDNFDEEDDEIDYDENEDEEDDDEEEEDEEEEENDDDEFDENGEDEEDGVIKKGTIKETEATVKPVASAPAVAPIAQTATPEKRKRGRPRKTKE